MKKPLLVIAKLIFSISLIGWILQKTDLAAIWLSLKGANFYLVVAAFLLFYIGYLIIAMRQRMLLAAQNIPVSIGFLVQSFAIGMFFTNMLPSTIGGDASRMYDIYRVAGSKSKAVSVILIDRFFGMFALVIYGFVAALMSPQIRQSVPGIALYLGLGLVAMASVLWIVFGTGAAMVDRIMALRLGPLSVIQRLMARIISSFELFRGRGDVLVRATLWSFLLQLNVIVHFILLSRALDIAVPIEAMFVIIPIASILMLIPISINGIGLRETIFVFLFGIYGTSVSASVAFSWIALSLLLVQGVVGGLVFLTRRRIAPMSREGVVDISDKT